MTNDFHNSTSSTDQQYAHQLDAQLAELAASAFPANNAVEFQTIDVVLDGSEQDISSLFDFTDVAAFDLIDFVESELPLGFVASVIDPQTGLPRGEVTDAIHLVFEDNLM